MSFIVSFGCKEICIYRVEKINTSYSVVKMIVKKKVDVNNVDTFDDNKIKCWFKQNVDDTKFKLRYHDKEGTMFYSNNLFVEQNNELHIIDSDLSIHEFKLYFDFVKKSNDDTQNYKYKMINTFEELKDFVCGFYDETNYVMK